jgi:hypothetical protein
MKKVLVWLAGALLALSFVFPNGLPLPTPAPAPAPAPTPDPAPLPAPAAPAPEIVALLRNADAADKRRIADVYTAAATILRRDNGTRLNTTEKWAEWHAQTLQLAIETPGKYPGLDEAIEQVFAAAIGTDDVLSVTPEVQAKLIAACDTVAASAR